MKKVHVMMTHAGGGHKTLAKVLQAVFQQQGEWEVHIVDFYAEALGSRPNLFSRLGIISEKFYLLILTKNMGWLTKFFGFIVMAIKKIGYKSTVKTLRHYWRLNPSDLVISVMPVVNGAIYHSLQGVLPTPPFITYVADFDEWLPTSWIEEKQQYFICSTEKCKKQIRDYGVDDQHIFLTTGFLVHPKFQQTQPENKKILREKMGLDPNLPTGVVIFGGYASPSMTKILKKVSQESTFQLIFICGKNPKIKQILSTQKTTLRKIVLGHVENVEDYMHAADFFIGKPGPNCVSEALSAGLPVIVESTFFTLPQERYVADWVAEKGVGLKIKHYHQINDFIQQIIEKYASFSDRIAHLKNHSFCEISEIIKKILVKHSS